MKTIKLFLLAGLLSGVFNVSFSQKKVAPPAPVLPVPTAAQLAWHEMEMNAFIHFTTNTFTGLEWGMGSESPSVFNPSQVDVNQWVSVLKATGMKGIILTCKHHDGFCLWPSKYTDHTVKNSPYKGGNGDIVKELSDECKKQNVKFGVYLSPWDRNRADYGTPSYIEYYRNQLKELFNAYGPVFEMWFDGANGGTGYYGGANEKRSIDGRTYYDWPKTLDLVRSMEPNVIFFSDAGPGVRWCGNEEGHVNTTNWNMITPDTLYAGKPGISQFLGTGSENGSQWIPAECDVSIRPGWFYHDHEDSKVRTPENLFELYLSSVGRGSLLLLNVPPDKRGMFHENDVKSLKGFRELLDKEFKTNLALNAKAKANNIRGKSATYAANMTTDGKKETFWATDDEILTGTLEINLNKEELIKYVVLQEYIQLGQRVKKFTVEIKQNNNWVKVAEGTTIGHKRILKIDPVKSSGVRVSILDSRACPLLSNIEVY